MKRATKMLSVLTVIILIGYFTSPIVAADEILKKGNVSIIWQEKYRGFSLVVNSDFFLMPRVQLRKEFYHLDWQDQRLTRIELSPCWENVILEAVGAKGFLEFDSIGIGTTFAWSDQVSSIPLASRIPRRGFLYFVSKTKVTDVKDIGRVESFVKIKNYYLENLTKGFEAKSWVRFKSFCLYLSGLKFQGPNLLSQLVRIKIELFQSILTSLNISCAFGIEINEAVYKKNFSDKEYQHFLTEDWFGEVVFHSRNNTIAFGLNFDENQHFYINMSISLLFGSRLSYKV